MQNTSGDLPPEQGWKREVEKFFEQVLDRAFEMRAERIRFEADGENIFLRYYAGKEALKAIHLKSSAFEKIWQWLIEDGFQNYKPSLLDAPVLEVRFPYHDQVVACLAQRSKTLRLKSSLLLWDFNRQDADKPRSVLPDGFDMQLPAPPVMETTQILEAPELFDDQDDELERLRRKAQIDSGALQRLPRFRKSSIPPKRDATGKCVILVVEDQADQRQLMKIALQKLNYVVDEAHDGQQALDYLAKHLPDAIITDLMMPIMDGSELVRRVKRDPNLQHIPLMVFTVISDPSIEYDILDLGADDYCEKTASPKLFLKRLEKLLNRSHGAQSGAFLRE